MLNPQQAARPQASLSGQQQLEILYQSAPASAAEAGALSMQGCRVRGVMLTCHRPQVV